MSENKTFSLHGGVQIGNSLPFALIAGPCAIESRDHALEVAGALKEITQKLNIPLIYKSSFDKANRSSLHAGRGIGFKAALPILAEIRESLEIPVTTDVHEAGQCEIVAEAVDILQIPAFLSRQTDLLIAAGKTGKIVNVKKGQFLSPYDIEKVIEKITSTGNDKIMLCERGNSFGYNNLVTDMRNLVIMARLGYPVVLDATHSVQQPSEFSRVSGANYMLAPAIARAGIAVGVAAVFMETHPDPAKAPSDKENMIPLAEMPALLELLQNIDKLAKAAPISL